MKTSAPKSTASKQKRQPPAKASSRGKKSSSTAARKKTQKPVSQKKELPKERRHFKRRSSDSDAVRNHLQATVSHQADELKTKNGQIKQQREELLHVTRVGKLAEFVSSLAHEISQPLTAILSYAKAAQRMLDGREPEIEEILQHIIDDDQRASEVIRRLRSLLKKSDPEFGPLDLNALIDETVVLLATDVTVRKKMIKTQLRPGLPLVRVDRVQMQQVILNLVSNSLDAMEKSDKYRELMIRTSLKGPGSVMVEVHDSGSGIAKEDAAKLFSHFFTTKPDGLGMGLSISRSIIEAHGGRLNAKNNPDGGATFYFTLPVISDKSAVSGDLS